MASMARAAEQSLSTLQVSTPRHLEGHMSTTSSTKPQMRVAPNDTTAANVSPSKKRKRATKGIATTTHPSIDTGLAVEAAPGDYENDLEPATSLPTKRLKTGEAPVSEEDEVTTQAEPEDINTVIEDADLDGYKDDVEAGASSDEDQYSEAPMTTKGKGRGKAKTSTRSKKKADPVPLLTDAEMQAYIAGLATITDWTCEGIIPDYCKIIEWVDKDRLVTKEVVKRWIEILKRPVGEKANVAANIYKHHKKWSKVFYMKKLGLKCPGMQEFKNYLAAQKGRAEGLPSLLPPTERLGRKKVNKVNTQRAVQKNGTPAGCQVTAPTTTTSTNGHRNDSQGVHQVIASTGSQVDQATAASDQNSNPAGDDEPDHQGATIFKDGNNEEIMEQPEPQTAKKPKKVKKAPKPPTLDQQLQLLFAEASTPAKNSAGFTIRRGKKKSTPPIEPAHLSEPSKDDIARYYANRNTQTVLYFTHSSGDAILGHPSRPVIDRQCALQYSEYFLEADSEKKFDVIKYGADIDENTIGRFVACISPCLRKDLPTHDIVEIGHEELRTTEIQWSMKELKDLYLLAEELQAWDVVDMVTDRWHIELHRAFPRDIENEFGVGKKFDILEFSPDFLQHLARHDPTGLEFFTDVLVMRRKEGWRHMLKYGLEMWNEGIKRIVIEKLMHDHEPKVLVKEERYICEHFHRHHEYQGYVCYKVAGQEEPEGQADSEDAPEVAPEDTSPVAQYWKRQPSLRTEQNDTKALHLRTQGSKRKRLGDQDQAALDSTKAHLKEHTKMRRKAEEALEEQEADMPSITITCFREREYNEHDIYELEERRAIARAERAAQALAASEPVQKPATEGGFLYPPQLGNGTKDSKRQAKGKITMLKEKLLQFGSAGYDVGEIGDAPVQQDEDVEMSDGDDEDKDGDENGHEEDGEDEGNE